MTKEAAIIVMISFGVLLLAAMAFAWRRRLRRDSGLSAPIGVPEDAVPGTRFEVLYVVTTRHDEPLERIALSPLTYRARGEVSVTDRGLALWLDGSPPVFLASENLEGVGRSTWTIDRVVEPGGLVRIIWRVEGDTLVDSYLRVVTGDPAELIEKIDGLRGAKKNEGAA